MYPDVSIAAPAPTEKLESHTIHTYKETRRKKVVWVDFKND